MLPRLLSLCLQGLILLVATNVAGAQQAPASHQSVFTINGLGKGSIPLDGPWQFHLGDNQAWASPALDDSHWEQLSGNRPWGAQTHPGYTGYAWYRLHIRVDAAPGAPADVALLIPGINDAYQLYWNGAFVGSQGRMPPRPAWYRGATPQTLGLGSARDGVIAVRVWKTELNFTDTGTGGGLTAPIEIGSPQAIAAVMAQAQGTDILANAFDISLYSVFCLLGFAALILWLRNRSQTLFLWAACFLINPGLGSLIGLRGTLMDPWAESITLVTTCIENIGLWFLLCWLLNLRENQKLMRLTRIAAVCLVIATITDSAFTAFGLESLHGAARQIPEAVLTTFTTAFGLWNLVPVAVAVFTRARLDRARWLFALTSSFAQSIFVTGTVLALGRRFTHVSFSHYSFRTMFLFSGSIINLQNLSDSLLILSLIYAIYRFSAENRDRQAALEQEFRNARELQQVLIPETLPEIPGFTLTSAYKPALEVGGDFFQIIPVADGSTLIVLGDVSGKGLKAAMAVSLIVGATRMVAEFTKSPAEILAGLNRRLHGRLQGGFATCIAMRLVPDGNCLISSAGHPAPFRNGGELTLPGALPLGISPDAVYEEKTISIHPGDHFALYTDGLLEARSPSGELYGFDRLRILFSAKPTADEATEAAVTFGQDDDITVLTLTRLAAARESSTSHNGPVLVSA